MGIRRLRFVGVALITIGCATALPPVARVSDVKMLAGTYSGTTAEYGQPDRSTRLVVDPDGKFELTASDPAGFRVVGRMALDPAGELSYEYGEQRGRGQVSQGRVVLHEGDGQQVLVLTKADGSMTTTVSRSRP